MKRKAGILIPVMLGAAVWLTACASREYTSVEDYIQLKEGVEVSEAAEEETSDEAPDGEELEEADDAADDSTSEAAASSAGAGSWQWEQAMESYKGYLEDLAGLDRYDTMAFWPIGDINNDGVPELLVKLSDVSWIDAEGYYSNQIQLESYIPSRKEGFIGNVQIKAVATGDGTGGWYYPGTGVVAMNDGEGEGYADYYYFPESVTNLEDWPKQTLIGEYGKRLGESVYFWLGKSYTIADAGDDNYYPDKEGTVEKERFEELLEELTGGVKKVNFPSSDEWYDNTAENREAYLK